MRISGGGAKTAMVLIDLLWTSLKHKTIYTSYKAVLYVCYIKHLNERLELRISERMTQTSGLAGKTTLWKLACRAYLRADV